MPPKQRQTSRKSIEQEGRIQLALLALQKGEIYNIREVARRFQIPRTTLQRRRDS